MSSSTFKADRCGVDNCRSRRYTTAEDGYAYCENGHQHSGFGTQGAGEDEDDFNTQGRVSRRKVEKEDQGSRLLSGREALELYLHCYQLILWKQSHWLINTKGLPAELEFVVHDLWALRLQSLKTKVETASDAESQVFSSQSEGETTDTDNDNVARLTRRGRQPDGAPKLIDTIVLCYLAMLMLRLPACLGDLFAWAANGELVYYRARAHVPPDMRDRLPATYHNALEPSSTLTPTTLQKAVVDLFIAYAREYGMAFPPLNYPLVLFRYLKDLTLPLEVYPAVLSLANLVGYNFSFPEFGTRRRLRPADLPEAQVASLVVVAVKLLYPWDAVERHPYSASDLGAMKLDWAAWTKASRHLSELTAPRGRVNFERAIQTAESDVMRMEGKEVDDYLNWYEDMFIDESAEKLPRVDDFRKALFKMFPTGLPAGQEREPVPSGLEDDKLAKAQEKRIRAVQGTLMPIEAVPKEAEDAERVRRPGSFYKRYREPVELEGTAKIFYETVAKQAGLTLKSLVKGVFFTERRLERWINKERKMEKEAEVM
ncbi:RNA polymerase I-specific transcription initiation factor Rrn7 [Phyllosticta capitalensis]